MIGIYKITNLVENKSYIGQSVHIERRWIEHKLPSSTSQISKAIKEYGIDNFIFEVIEECEIGQLNEKERKWIKYYNTITPNGYNIVEDTSDTIHTSYRFFDKEILLQIINTIKNSNMTLKEIAKKFNVHISTISRINKGEIHFQEDEHYPLRQIRSKKNNYCIDCGKELSNSTVKRCAQCSKLAQRTVNRPSRDELKNLIRNKSFTQIANQFNVSDNAIRKWCNFEKLPTRKKDIKSYSDEEWDLL